MKALLMLALAAAPLLVAQPDESLRVRSLLNRLNRAVARADARAVARLFTQSAVYADPARTASGRSEIAVLLTYRQPWSERTPPVLEPYAIRVHGTTAHVDAHVCEWGSMGQTCVTASLSLEKRGGLWRIAAWGSAPPGLVSLPIPSSPR